MVGGGQRKSLSTFSEAQWHTVSQSLWENLKYYVHLAAGVGSQRRTSWKGLPAPCPQPGIWYSSYLQLGVCIMGEGTNSRADRQEPSWSLVGWLCPLHPKPYPLSLQHFRWYLCGSLCGMKDGTVLSIVPGTKIDGQWLLCFWVVNNGISLSSMKQRMNWLEGIR